jgi:hypothetical protein
MGYVVPPGLQEWSDLNDQADRAAQCEDWVEYHRLYPEIMEAWESAPFRDRSAVSWELLKKAWKERHLDYREGLYGPG